jgi:hypothetical protein
MKKNRSHFFAGILLLLGITLVSTGCLPKTAPPYKGGLAEEPTQMTPYVDKENKIEMALPPGWKSVPFESTVAWKKAEFKKHGSDADLQLFCASQFDSKASMALFALKFGSELDPKATQMWERKSFGGGFFDPEFEAYTGKDTNQNFYIAWKLASGFKCRYILIMMVPKDDADYVEGDFIAIVRSLKL